ncbi:hypothetical protein O7628_00790 [Micromonospora sp. WMMD956]|uniref:hypothetical protein n=1 Tax=Micromonospora TaxID=1873 RepID=UPI002417A425|nr:hypothetical protein [Micromonospora sp. WMMD956]MDG4814042.1 hypothetical protein [Micromonospora sp. WMMD956]
MTTILDHPYVQDLLSLGLPSADYVIAGSGPLLARGWISDPGDIDVVARGSAWRLACAHGQPTDAPYSSVQRLQLFGGHVEVLDGWFPELWPTDELIDEADVIHGIRFVRLAVVAATKRMLHRPRDLEHLAIMAAHGCHT